MPITKPEQLAFAPHVHARAASTVEAFTIKRNDFRRATVSQFELKARHANRQPAPELAASLKVQLHGVSLSPLVACNAGPRIVVYRKGLTPS